jgi:hypothetical protein
MLKRHFYQGVSLAEPQMAISAANPIAIQIAIL